jgi:hypothetical protein
MHRDAQLLASVKASLEASSGGNWHITPKGRLAGFISIGAPSFFDNTSYTTQNRRAGSTLEFNDFLNAIIALVKQDYVNWGMTKLCKADSTGDESKYFRFEVEIPIIYHRFLSPEDREKILDETDKLGNFLRDSVAEYQKDLADRNVPKQVLDAIIDYGSKNFSNKATADLTRIDRGR